jgi:hypothetical protein
MPELFYNEEVASNIRIAVQEEVFMNKTALRRLGIIAMASLLTVGVQIASGRAETWSSPNWRPVSGLTGDKSVFYTSSSPTHALNRLEFYEHNNDPMLINIWLEKLCHDPPCDPGERNIELRIGSHDENLGSKEIISAGDDHYITAIQVCTTNDTDQRKREIKGARIWTARLEPGGIVNPTGTPPLKFDRANCNNHWREKQTCLGNRVAVGLRAYFNDDSPQFNNRFWFTGLELQCAFVNEDPETDRSTAGR